MSINSICCFTLSMPWSRFHTGAMNPAICAVDFSNMSPSLDRHTSSSFWTLDKRPVPGKPHFQVHLYKKTTNSQDQNEAQNITNSTLSYHPHL